MNLAEPDLPSSKNPLELSRRVIGKIRQKGVKRSVKLASDIAVTQGKRRIPGSARQLVFLSHPMDFTGAPLVLLDVVEEFQAAYRSKHLRLIAPSALPDIRARLTKSHIHAEKAAVLSPRLTGLQLALRKDDFVLMNTVAVYDNYLSYVLNSLKHGTLAHATWFIHEDIPQVQTINKKLTESTYVKKIHELIEAGKLTIQVPSKRIKQAFDKLYNTDKVGIIPLRVEAPEKYCKPRQASDYERLGFVLSGTPSDGRKGHLIALAAFHEFLNTAYRDNPKAYRDFGVHFISIKHDYVSEQITTLGKTILGDRLRLYPQLPKDEAMRVTAEGNATICCSLNETFALYVVEGMLMGHIILRNNTAGIDEQLQEGKNGYAIDHTNIKQFATVIEKLLNKKTTSNKDLQAMGALSQQIAEPYRKNKYLDLINH